MSPAIIELQCFGHLLPLELIEPGLWINSFMPEGKFRGQIGYQILRKFLPEFQTDEVFQGHYDNERCAIIYGEHITLEKVENSFWCEVIISLEPSSLIYYGRGRQDIVTVL
jgi:hypothetical protein